MGRPGLVDLLLRTGGVGPDQSLLSEADVFNAVWNGLVLNDGVVVASGVSPDDREEAALAVALTALGRRATAPAGPVRADLRSDGVLRAPANPAFSDGDGFATDLWRDFALCRLFVRDGLGVLADVSAPRWAIRAARLTCQVQLRGPDRRRAWMTLRTVFADIASVHGDRWREVPVEALLTLGDAQQAITDLWVELAEGDRAELRMLVRLAQQRHVEATVGDAFALGPVVAATFLSTDDLGQHDAYGSRHELGAGIRDLVLTWLRGMADLNRGPDGIRQQVRDAILDKQPNDHDEFAVEALASLGPDLDESASSWLQDVATHRPNRLQSAVEGLGPLLSLPLYHPQLLLALADAYYISRPTRSDHWGSDVGWHDFGIRHMGHASLGGPMVAWYLGPFYRLLRAAPREAIALINRMLDHAVHAPEASTWRPPGETLTSPSGEDDFISVDVPGLGPRRYTGDERAWSWYRGSTVGPYPGMSALLAVEKYADELVDIADIPLSTVVEFLLRDCHNLAMPGLVVGLLARHLERAADLLDPWLSVPDVWSLESRRVTMEHFKVQGPDPDDLTGKEHRSHSARDIGAHMVLRAMLTGDTARLDALGLVADQLMANAREERPETGTDESTNADRQDEHDEFMVRVEGWAAILRPESYDAATNADGDVVVSYSPPPAVAAAMAPQQGTLARFNEAIRLQVAYAHHNDSDDGWPTENLLTDLAAARHLAQSPPENSPSEVLDAVTAVAAAAVAAFHAGTVDVPDDDLRWAAGALLRAAGHPLVDDMAYEGTSFSISADRAAARTVPLLTLETFDHLGLDALAVTLALDALGSSPFDEVRTLFVTGCIPVWEAACAPSEDSRCRRHHAVWCAATFGLSGCRLGPFDFATQRRTNVRLDPPFVDALPGVPTEDLLLNRLTTPLAATAAARAAACLRDEADTLLPVLINAHRRSYDHWMRENYGGYSDQHSELAARVLIDLALDGDTSHLQAYVTACVGNNRALSELLRHVSVVFTYHPDLTGRLGSVWPLVMRTALDAIDDGADLFADPHWADYALGALLPAPEVRMSDTDVDTTLARARSTWIDPAAIADLVPRWLRLAVGEPKAADALAKFARTTAMSWQQSTGLTWLEQVVGPRFDLVANRCWDVARWLHDLRATDDLSSAGTVLEGEALARWHRVVDGLAAASDTRAAALQSLDE